MKENPFKSVPPGEPPPPVCPFIGGMSVPVMEQGISRTANPLDSMKIGFQLLPCQKEKCAMWDAEREGCAIKIGMAALEEIRQPLLRLSSMFGSRE